MVFESLIRAKRAEQRPWYVFLLGILYGTIGIIFDLWLFEGRIENLFINITVFASIPLMYHIIILEEKKDKRYAKETNLLQEHKKALAAFIALFLGILVAFTFWYTVLPEDTINNLFSAQIKEIPLVREAVSGRAISSGTVMPVFLHNMKVLLFSILFSFFFGAGAIFILSWNAALIAVALGTFFRAAFASLNPQGMPLFVQYLGTISYGFFGYLTHGIFEMASYFLAGIAGGIISVAAIKHDLSSPNFKKIVTDTLWLIGLSVLLLFISALIEALISPTLFV